MMGLFPDPETQRRQQDNVDAEGLFQCRRRPNKRHLLAFILALFFRFMNINGAC